MAGGELLVITTALADSDQQVALASDWSIAMDLLLTEVKVPQINYLEMPRKPAGNMSK